MAVAKRVKSAAPARKSRYAKAEGDRVDHRGEQLIMTTLRMPADLAARLDRALQKIVSRESRNSYILAAIAARLDQDLGG